MNRVAAGMKIRRQQPRAHSPEESLGAQAEFEQELETFRIDYEQVGQFFYAYLAVHATARESKDVYHLVNGSALFWNTLLGGLQTATFIALGRIFDTKTPHGLYRVLRISQEYPEIFSKPFLARRKQGKAQHPPGWLAEYLEQVYEPSPEDFRRLKRHVQERKTIYERNYDPVRDHFAHRLTADSQKIDALFAAMNIRELQRMVGFLAALYDALWELFTNGEKPRLRPQRYSTARMRRLPSHRGNVQERITHEAEAFLRAAATAQVAAPSRRT